MTEKIHDYLFQRFIDAPSDSFREAFWNILLAFLDNPQSEIEELFNGGTYRYIKYTVKRW